MFIEEGDMDNYDILQAGNKLKDSNKRMLISFWIRNWKSCTKTAQKGLKSPDVNIADFAWSLSWVYASKGLIFRFNKKKQMDPKFRAKYWYPRFSKMYSKLAGYVDVALRVDDIMTVVSN